MPLFCDNPTKVIRSFAAEGEFLTGAERDVIKLRFRHAEELSKVGLADFLKEHLGQLGNGTARR
jgi:hypothetical protein